MHMCKGHGKQTHRISLQSRPICPEMVDIHQGGIITNSSLSIGAWLFDQVPSNGDSNEGRLGRSMHQKAID